MFSACFYIIKIMHIYISEVLKNATVLQAPKQNKNL